jgi:N-acetylmuramoyl-L-alanine amidase
MAQVELYGRSYVRLDDWARANHFDYRRVKGENSLQLTSGSGQFVITPDSREASLNGVRAVLSYPIAVKYGSAYIAQVDLDTLTNPILFPNQKSAGSRLRNIVLDPGHGGKDPGFESGSHQEKKYTLMLAQELRGQLNQAGFNTSLTRTDDTFVPLASRPDIARKQRADLFISLHWNVVPGDSSVRGAQTFCLTPAGASSSNVGGSLIGSGASPGNRNNGKNVLLAYEVQKSLLNRVGVVDRGVRRARYWVLRDATMPAILIEGGFMSNPSESRRIYDPAYLKQMAQAIVQGVIAYKNRVE